MGLGDEVMVSGQCRYLQMRDPRKVRIRYEKPRWMEIWARNPRIVQPTDAKDGDYQEFVPRNGYRRPYIVDKNEKQWTWQKWGPEWGGRAPVGEIYLQKDEVGFGQVNSAGCVLVEPNLKGAASPNKQWGVERWMLLVETLRGRGHRVVQFGPHGTKVLPGAALITTPRIREAASALIPLNGAILSEGGLHHMAAAMGTPNVVVIFGAYISPEVTGYDTQTNLFTGEGLGCGMRVPCKCCVSAMAKITPEMVVETFDRLLGAV